MRVGSATVTGEVAMSHSRYLVANSCLVWALCVCIQPIPPMSRFQSSNDSEELTSLEEYLERMKEKQDHIYFMAAPTREEAASSPFVERLLRKGYEVLYLVDPVDEYCVQVGGNSK